VGVLIGETAKANIKDVFPVLYIALGVFAVVFFVLLFVRIPEPHIEQSKEPLGQLMKGALSYRHFVLGAIAIFVYVGVEVGTPYLMLYWLSELPEVGKTIAGSVAGTYWFLMLIGRLAGASIGSKVSSRTMLSVTSLVGGILVLVSIFMPMHTMVSLPVLQHSATGALYFGFANVPINAMFIVLVGLCTSVMWGGIFNLAVEGLGKYTAAASGIFMVMVCGGGILPAFQGWVADKVGELGSYWVVVAGMAYLLFYALLGSRQVVKNEN
jgi:FHS family L-fucose permease-like MFS transporter